MAEQHTSAVTESQPIPFKSSSAVSADTLMDTLLYLVCILALVLLAAKLAKKLGWAKQSAAADDKIKVTAVKKLSAKTVLMRVEVEGQALIVIESSASQVNVLPEHKIHQVQRPDIANTMDKHESN